MPKKKIRTYTKKSFESTGASSDTSSNIYMSMLLSPAWKALTAKQQVLYLYCKAQLYAERNRPVTENSALFTMNQAKWCSLYGLYTTANKRMFYRDMTELINKGFVTCEECGALTRTKSIYALSGNWKDYGTDRFSVSPSSMTLAGQRQVCKKKPQSMANIY